MTVTKNVLKTGSTQQEVVTENELKTGSTQKEVVTKEEADQIKSELEEVGAIVEIK